MKPRYSPATFKKKTQSAFMTRTILLLLLSTTIFYGCGNNNSSKSKTGLESTSIQYMDDSSVTVTFTTSNHQQKKYTHFKLGLMDIIFHIRSGDELFVQSLYNRGLHNEMDPSQILGLELTTLPENTHLYHGVFNVPSGVLEKVEVVFSGAQTSIAMGNDQIGLIDSFYNHFQANNDQDGANVRKIPLHVQTLAPEDFILPKNSATIINIDINTDLSITPDPLKHEGTENKYALFTPAIKVKGIKKIDANFEPFDLVFKQFQYIDMTLGNDLGDVMAVGNQEEMVFIADYAVTPTAELTLDGNALADITQIKGLHYFDLTGTLTVSNAGYQYDINKASLLAPSENPKSARYEGRVTSVNGEKISLKGHRLSLYAHNESISREEYFDGEISGYFSHINVDDDVTIQANGNAMDTLILKKQRSVTDTATTETLEILSTLAFAAEDMLKIKQAEIKNGILTLQVEDLPCNTYIKVSNEKNPYTCDKGRTFNKIKFYMATLGEFTLVETRKGAFDAMSADALTEANQNPELLIYEPDIIHHFTDTNTFIQTVIQLVNRGARSIRIVANGRLINDTFTVNDKASMILLKGQPELDNDMDNIIAFIIGSELTDSDNNDSSLVDPASISIITLSTPAIAAATAAIGTYISRRNTGALDAFFPISERQPKDAKTSYSSGFGTTLTQLPEKQSTINTEGGIHLEDALDRGDDNDLTKKLIMTENTKKVILVSNELADNKALNGMTETEYTHEKTFLTTEPATNKTTGIILAGPDDIPAVPTTINRPIDLLYKSNSPGLDIIRSLNEVAIELRNIENSNKKYSEEQISKMPPARRFALAYVTLARERQASTRANDTGKSVTSNAAQPSLKKLFLKDLQKTIIEFSKDERIVNRLDLTKQLEKTFNTPATPTDINTSKATKAPKMLKNLPQTPDEISTSRRRKL